MAKNKRNLMQVSSKVFSGFPKQGLKFLDNIIINNSKEWLDAHREVLGVSYHLKNPFKT